jgi:hypothetical protein
VQKRPPWVWKSYDDVPGWKFALDEFSPGAYRAEGRDTAGRSVSLTRADPERLLEDAKRWAQQNRDALPTRAEDAR